MKTRLLRKDFFRFLIAATFCLSAAQKLHAQWVLIPDPNFRHAIDSLAPGAITGNNMDTTNSLIVNMASLDVSGLNIYNLEGIEYFKSLQTLNCSFNPLSDLPFLPSLLINLDCSYNSLTNLLALSSSITNLNCLANQLTPLPALPSSLTHLYCQFNYSLTDLPLLPSSLYELSCFSCSLTYLPVLPASFNVLDCSLNFITFLPALPSSLTALACYSNQLTSLRDLPSSLNILECNNNSISCLPLLPLLLQSLYGLNAGYTCLPNKPAGLTVWQGPSTLCFSISSSGSTSFCQGGSVILSADSGNSYVWNTGATTQSITVTTAGAYSCRINASCGNAISNAITVIAIPSPIASFSLSADTMQLHHYIAVNNSSGIQPINYDCSWGDGTHDTIPYPSHTYADSGLYTICLSVTDSTGCSSTFCDSSYHIMRTTNYMVYINVVPPLILGNEGISELIKEINLYPNPATNQIRINSSSLHVNETATISIMNVLGQEASPPAPLPRLLCTHIFACS